MAFDTNAFSFGNTSTNAFAFPAADTNAFSFTNTNWGAPAATQPAATTTGFDWGQPAAQPAAVQGLNLGGLGTNNAFNIGGFNAGGTVPFVKPNSKFIDLPDNYKKKYQDLEQYIQAQRKTRDEIADDIKKPIPRENISVDSLNERLASLSRDIQKESRGLQSYIDRVRTELKYGEQAARNLTKAKAQRTGAASPFNTTVPLPSQYHWEKLTGFNDSLDRISRQIDEIDQYLVATEQTSGAGGGPVSQRFAHHPKALQQILVTQHTALCALTARVAQLHSLCDELREKYRTLKTGENQSRGYRPGAAAAAGGGSSYSYPSVFGSGGAAGLGGSAYGSAYGSNSLYDKVAGGGGNDLIGSGGIVFEGENDDLVDEKRNRSDPFSELSFLNSSASTSLVPQPQSGAAPAAGTAGTAPAAGTTAAPATTSFDFGFGSSTAATNTAATTQFSFGAPATNTAPAVPAFDLSATTNQFNFGAPAATNTAGAFSFGETTFKFG